MNTTITKKRLPLLWFLAAVSTLVYYEQSWESGKVFFDGLGVGVGLSVVVAIVLVIRIFRRVEDVLISKGAIHGRVSTPYDLFPVFLLLPFGFGGQWFGDLLPSAAAKYEPVYRWVFKWGTDEHKFLIYLAILGLILLYRIHQLLAAIAPKRKEHS